MRSMSIWKGAHPRPQLSKGMTLTGAISTFGISESQLEEVKALADSWTLESAKIVRPKPAPEPSA